MKLDMKIISGWFLGKHGIALAIKAQPLKKSAKIADPIASPFEDFDFII